MAEACLCAPIDANGNLTADGTRTFEWDARNQLVAVTVGTHRSEFSYDGRQRRVRAVEKENGVVQSDTKILWCNSAICEERAADGVTVTRPAFGLGEQVSGDARYFATDHLGSVREVTDGAGALLARYAFEPWGRRTVTAGADVTTVGFTLGSVSSARRFQSHLLTFAGLALTRYRPYSIEQGRWATEDPVGLLDGTNRYIFGRNTPIRNVDPTGLLSECAQKAWNSFLWCTGVFFVAVDIPVTASFVACFSTGPGAVPCITTVAIVWEVVEVVNITACAIGAVQQYNRCKSCPAENSEKK